MSVGINTSTYFSDELMSDCNLHVYECTKMSISVDLSMICSSYQIKLEYSYVKTDIPPLDQPVSYMHIHNMLTLIHV